jgi:long-chain acyl-CoA synthetase
MLKLKESIGVFYPDVIANNAHLFPKKLALVCGPDRLNWQQFHSATNQGANFLVEQGLKKGDKVCLVAANGTSAFLLLWATVKAGGVIVPLNPTNTPEQLEKMIDNSDAGFIFADGAGASSIQTIRERLHKISSERFFGFDIRLQGWRDADKLIKSAADEDIDIAFDPSDSFNIIYTSGSTGNPKGSEHTHFARTLYPMTGGHGTEINRDTIGLCATPLYTNGTWVTFLSTVFLGATTILLLRFTPDNFLQAIESERCTHVFMVPTQYIRILEAGEFDKYDVSSMRVLISGGQALNPNVFDRLHQRFPNAKVYEIYGLSEGFGNATTPADCDHGRRGSGGLSLFGADVCVIDEDGREVQRGEVGEIVGWSAAQMKGYYKDPQRTSDLIWLDPRGRTYLRTGDLGRMDRDGYVYVMGRLKDMIKSGGITIVANDLEEVFSRHPDVVEVAAIAIPHDKWVETPLLLAIIRDGARITEDELKEWGNQKLAKWQRVSRVEFRKEFPRTPGLDKVLKRALRDPFWAGT